MIGELVMSFLNVKIIHARFTPNQVGRKRLIVTKYTGFLFNKSIVSSRQVVIVYLVRTHNFSRYTQNNHTCRT